MCIYTYVIMKCDVKFFKALGDETRICIVRCLLNQEQCACNFTSTASKDQTTISRHLKVLVDAGILKYEKNGRKIIYSIKDNDVKEVLLHLGLEPLSCSCD